MADAILKGLLGWDRAAAMMVASRGTPGRGELRNGEWWEGGGRVEGMRYTRGKGG